MPRRPVRRLRAGCRGRHLASLILPATLLLIGCTTAPSGDTPASPTSTAPVVASSAAGQTAGATPTGATPTGPVDAADAVAGRSGGYSVVPPDGWGEVTEQAGQAAGVDLVLLSSAKVAGFSSNFVVHLGTGDAATLRTELEKGREQMSADGRAVSDSPAVTVAGEPATGFTTSFTQQGVKIVARSYGLHHDGRIYLLTLSSSQEAAATAAGELRAILDSWAWG